MLKPTLEELQNRINRDADHFGGNLPERTALTWYGYIAALLEWNLISVEDHQRLTQLLPPIQDNPVIGILTGRR